MTGGKTAIPKAAIEAAVPIMQEHSACNTEGCKQCYSATEDVLSAALPHFPGYKEPIIKAVERILDECSAWIARPNHDVTVRIAMAAGIAMMASQSERHDRVYADGYAAGQEAMQIACANVIEEQECTDPLLPFCNNAANNAAKTGWVEAIERSVNVVAALPTIEVQAPSPWRPISEAPKDGTKVIAIDAERPDRVFVVAWRYGEWQALLSSVASMTHFMPLPSAPGQERDHG